MAESVRAHGMTMGLWFDPERVMREAYDAFPRKDLLKHWLVDLNLPEAQDGMVELMAGHAERLELGWIRWDMNFPPLGMWLNDAAELSGAELMEGVAMRIEQPRRARLIRYAAVP